MVVLQQPVLQNYNPCTNAANHMEATHVKHSRQGVEWQMDAHNLQLPPMTDLRWQLPVQLVVFQLPTVRVGGLLGIRIRLNMELDGGISQVWRAASGFLGCFLFPNNEEVFSNRPRQETSQLIPKEQATKGQQQTHDGERLRARPEPHSRRAP